MAAIKLAEIEHDLPGFLRRIESGECLLILRDEQPIAELWPWAVRKAQPPITPTNEPRPSGLCEGEFAVPDDFDAPLPEDILRDFEGR